jgi:CRISPR-associated endonuclease/helicase Cas3
MPAPIYYAHTLEDVNGNPRPESEWEPLYTGDGEGHLEKVADLAGEFASKFGARDWGYLAGLWHDFSAI